MRSYEMQPWDNELNASLVPDFDKGEVRPVVCAGQHVARKLTRWQVPLFAEWQRASLIENMTESCLQRLVKGTDVELDLFPLYADFHLFSVFAICQKHDTCFTVSPCDALAHWFSVTTATV